MASIRNELSDLKKYFEKLDSDLSVAWRVNSALRERMTSLEHQCWSNSQYSRHKCLELTSNPKTSDNKTLENKVLWFMAIYYPIDIQYSIHTKNGWYSFPGEFQSEILKF